MVLIVDMPHVRCARLSIRVRYTKSECRTSIRKLVNTRFVLGVLQHHIEIKLYAVI